MNFELLCGTCEQKERRGHEHKIRQELERAKMDNINSSEKDGLEPPPSSVIKKNEEEGVKERVPKTWSEYREQNDPKKEPTYRSIQPKQ